MIMGLVAGAVGWPDRLLAWLDRGCLVACIAIGLRYLGPWVREANRAAGWDRAGVGWPRRRTAALLAVGLLLAIVGLGALFLALDLPSRHPGSCWALLGLMSFIRPLRGLWDSTPSPPVAGRPAWMTEDRLEIGSGVLMLLMGITNCCAGRP